MIKIAIVEDEQEHADRLREYLLRFAKENNAVFEITAYKNAVIFLENYAGDWDAVFMDIRMPYINGMDAAHRLRELDKTVILIFITSLTQYAVEGYEVNACAYLVKPLLYPDFALKFMRAFEKLQAQDRTVILLPSERGVIKLQPNEIAYVEVIKHTCIYHTVRGDHAQYATLRSAEEKLASCGFCKCNHCYFVNLRYVRSLQDDIVEVAYADKTDRLSVSRSRKKTFGEALRAFLRGARPEGD